MKYNTALPYFPEEDIEKIICEFRKLLAGEGLLSMGKYVQEFEKNFANYIEVKYAIATTSCTSALETILTAIGVGHGDEVIVPSQTFIATASAVVRRDARPVFAEINNYFLLDFEDMKSKITEKTKAVICVHFAGLLDENLLEIKSWLKEREIFLIEDAAHAHGASLENKKAGSIGDVAAFSFYSTKNMTTGEGGMITTDDKLIAHKCRSIGSRGLDLQAGYEIFNELGTNQRMTEFQALMGISQLKRLDEFVTHRTKVADTYNKYLRPLSEIGTIRLLDVNNTKIIHSFWRYIIFLTNGQDREKIRENMEKNSIKIDWAYQPLVHLQPIMQELYATSRGDLPFSEHLAETHVCLPIHLGVSVDNAKYIVNRFIESI
jgi:perosamine synthetase